MPSRHAATGMRDTSSSIKKRRIRITFLPGLHRYWLLPTLATWHAICSVFCETLKEEVDMMNSMTGNKEREHGQIQN